jgi:hypothetical protein
MRPAKSMPLPQVDLGCSSPPGGLGPNAMASERSPSQTAMAIVHCLRQRQLLHHFPSCSTSVPARPLWLCRADCSAP